MLLFVANIASGLPHSPLAEARATATIRIERPAIASGQEWKRASKSSRREITIRDERGQPVVVRLIEYQ